MKSYILRTSFTAADSTSDQNEVSYWLGGNDIETEGVFKWVKSDLPMTYTDWSPGQPDDAGGEDCMELRGAFQYHWNDLPCNIPHHFICEAPYVYLTILFPGLNISIYLAIS